ncbi:MAG: hypothetical protein Q4C91_00100 [Eubacteriales bacterium]|nr:hypothetical protein [Eubacteriales bacterium]
MKVEEKWTNAGRDKITIGEVIEIAMEGFEFVVNGGHIVSVLFEMPEGEAA